MHHDVLTFYQVSLPLLSPSVARRPETSGSNPTWTQHAMLSIHIRFFTCPPCPSGYLRTRDERQSSEPESTSSRTRCHDLQRQLTLKQSITPASERVQSCWTHLHHPSGILVECRNGSPPMSPCRSGTSGPSTSPSWTSARVSSVTNPYWFGPAKKTYCQERCRRVIPPLNIPHLVVHFNIIGVPASQLDAPRSGVVFKKAVPATHRATSSVFIFFSC